MLDTGGEVVKIEFDVDSEKAQRPLTARERVGVYLLLAIFSIIFPIKHSFQAREFFETIMKELKS